MTKPVQVNIDLLDIPRCCKDTLIQMREKKEIAPLLEKAVIFGPIFTILGENKIHAMYQVNSSANDNNWMKAVQLIPKIAKKRLQAMAELEAIHHHNDRRMYSFWRKMADSFR